MYSIKVRGGAGKRDPASTADTTAGRSEAGTSSHAVLEGHGDLDTVFFSAGNPRVDHLTGVVHLYRHAPPSPKRAAPWNRGPKSERGLPEDRKPQLCILALPPDMGFTELSTFMGSHFAKAQEVRLVRREGGPGAARLVLLRFAVQRDADDFYAQHSGRALPSCPVCLERMDEESSGIVTTVCNHRFHNECLKHWGDSSCPVCRYCQPSIAAASKCSICACSTDLWICLICGHVGCGRYRGSHASDHWHAQGHGYALELGTQRVWDYLGDAYVHRLLQSKAGGKLVEVAGEEGGGGPSGGGRGAATGDDCCGSGAQGGEDFGHGLDQDPVHQVMALSKFEALVSEYNHLLVTQLESQRLHFESQLLRSRADVEQQMSEASVEVNSAREAARTSSKNETTARRAQQAAESKLASSREEASKLQKELRFLKDMYDALLTNQQQHIDRLKMVQEAAAASMAAKDATISDLQEQVRDFMVFIEARQAIGGSGAEMEGGSLLPLPPGQNGQGGGEKKQGRRKQRK